jgi:DNA-binding NarL/FixJ family response regulator
MNSLQISIAIIDDDPKSRGEVVKLFQEEEDMSIVAETSFAGAKEVEDQKPDVILIDSMQPFTEGLENTETIISRFQDTRIIFLSRDSSGKFITASECQSWACYPMCQDCSTDDVLAAIREGHQAG